MLSKPLVFRQKLIKTLDSAEEVHGAPLAIQIVARRYHDERLLEASQIIDRCLGT